MAALWLPAGAASAAPSDDPAARAGAPGGVIGAPVSAGGAHSCGVGGDGAVVCWGANSFRQSFTITVKASPTISTQASPDNLLGAPVRDVATLEGGSDATGTVTFPGSAGASPPTPPPSSASAAPRSRRRRRASP
jgi:hypothetical protein